jgi:hypothetical protein
MQAKEAVRHFLAKLVAPKKYLHRFSMTRQVENLSFFANFSAQHSVLPTVKMSTSKL